MNIMNFEFDLLIFQDINCLLTEVFDDFTDETELFIVLNYFRDFSDKIRFDSHIVFITIQRIVAQIFLIRIT